MKPFEITPEMEASKGIRFTHLIVDYLAFLAIIFVLMLVGMVIALLLGNESFGVWLTSEPASLNLISIFLYLFYYFAFEAFTGRTLAKFITGTIVVDEFGEKPSAKTALIRTVCRLIPFEYFSFFGDRGWHDSISNTYVVKKHIYIMRKNEVVELDEIGQNSELL